MNYLYFHAPTEADLIASLTFARLTDEDGDHWLTKGEGWSLAILGRLPDPTQPATFDEAGEQLTEQGWLPGFHANMIVRSSCTVTIPTEYQIPTPNNPQVLWMGQEL
jgi:hypothetical protein